MAKKRSGVNKSKAIREYYEQNPDAKPLDVVAALKQQGVNVSAAFVSTIRSTSKKKSAPTGKRGRPVGSTSARTSSGGGGGASVSIDSLLKMKSAVKDMGGIEKAKAALSALEKLID